MRGGVIVKSRKAHYSQVRYHAHSTYIQLATKQLEIKNQSKGHNPKTKKKKRKEKQDTNMYELTYKVQNTISHYELKGHTYIHKKHHQKQIFTKTLNTTNNKTQLYTKEKGDHSPLGSTNPKFHFKIDHPHNHNPKYPQLYTKIKEIKEKKKREKG